MILQAKEYESETDYKEKLIRFMHAEIRGEKIKELVECLKKVSQNYRVV